MPFSKKGVTCRKRGGFTLVEMVVVLGIFTVLTAIALANQGRFGEQVLLDNLAYEIALSMRQAQVYGISVREFRPSGEFAIPYGVRFNAQTPSTFILFADRDGNERYSGTSENVEIFTLRQGNQIAEFCVGSPGNLLCQNAATNMFVDVLFERPNPDAIIKSNITPDPVYSQARFRVMSPQGNTRDVSVAITGQISVQ